MGHQRRGSAGLVFASALLFDGVSSSISSALAGGSIFAGYFSEPLDVTDSHSRLGVVLSLGLAALAVLFLTDPFQGLIWSQVALSVQLPWTVFALIALTSSERVMGIHRNKGMEKWMLWGIGVLISVLNGILLYSFF